MIFRYLHRINTYSYSSTISLKKLSSPLAQKKLGNGRAVEYVRLDERLFVSSFFLVKAF